MLARYLLFTLIPCTLSATLPILNPAPSTTLPSPSPDFSTLNLTTTSAHCWNPPQPRISVWPARLPDCELAAYRILRFIDPFKPVTFSRAAGSAFQLPADYRYKSCWIHVNIDPGQADQLQPQTAYIAAWELARECTSGMYQFGGWRTVGPRDKVVLTITGEYVPGVSEEEGGSVDLNMKGGTANVTVVE